jgi:hypothetical protein
LRDFAVVATPLYERFLPKDQIEETLRGFMVAAVSYMGLCGSLLPVTRPTGLALT